MGDNKIYQLFGKFSCTLGFTLRDMKWHNTKAVYIACLINQTSILIVYVIALLQPFFSLHRKQNIPFQKLNSQFPFHNLCFTITTKTRKKIAVQYTTPQSRSRSMQKCELGSASSIMETHQSLQPQFSIHYMLHGHTHSYI